MKMLHMQYASLTWCATGTEGEGGSPYKEPALDEWLVVGPFSPRAQNRAKVCRKNAKMRRQKQKQKLNQPQLHGHVVCEAHSEWFRTFLCGTKIWKFSDKIVGDDKKEGEGEGALFRQLAILQFDCPSSLDSNRIVKIETGLWKLRCLNDNLVERLTTEFGSFSRMLPLWCCFAIIFLVLFIDGGGRTTWF